MRIQDIKIGEYYRLYDSPSYSWVKPLAKLKPKEGVNTKTYSIVRCEHMVNKSDSFGMVRYFRPSDISKQ